jgi:cytoskeletal protein CcmA (bactofilin family)
MVPSVIGEDLTVTGNIVSKGEVQIEGEVQGDIHCQSVVIGDKATVTGGLIADDVVIRGRVLGSVRAQRVTLQTSSHVEGDIHHQALAIEQGAFFEGKSRRSDNPMAGVKTEQPAQSTQKPSSASAIQRETSRPIGNSSSAIPVSTPVSPPRAAE